MAKAKQIQLTIPDQRMLELIELLKANGTIRFRQEFVDKLDMHKQGIPSIQSGRQHFTVEHIGRACKAYNVNANWIHGLSEQVFNQQAEIRFISQGAAPTKAEGKQKRS